MVNAVNNDLSRAYDPTKSQSKVDTGQRKRQEYGKGAIEGQIYNDKVCVMNAD